MLRRSILVELWGAVCSLVLLPLVLLPSANLSTRSVIQCPVLMQQHSRSYELSALYLSHGIPECATFTNSCLVTSWWLPRRVIRGRLSLRGCVFVCIYLKIFLPGYESLSCVCFSSYDL